MVEAYRKTGYIEMVSGFRRYGPLDTLQIGNTPVQGAAFHVLLENAAKRWRDMIQLGTPSEMVAEIHDSLLFDIIENDVDWIIEHGTRLLTELPEWMPNSVPLKVDWKVGTDWGSMEGV